tara:strand:+ start:854 stop:1405 length:552 start_codon:yes stop_codon:yes gene_type:complete
MLLKNIIPIDLIEQAVDRIDQSIDRAKSIGPIRDEQITNNDTVSWISLLPELHDYIQKPLEEYFKVKLRKTNDFGRVYTQGAELISHYDNWHCEFSASLNLMNIPSDNSWPFYTSPTDNLSIEDWTGYKMKPGDAVAYKGEEVYHKRLVLDYEECYQWFFHFIEKNGQYDNEQYYYKTYERYK